MPKWRISSDAMVMRTTEDLLTSLHRRGVKLWTENLRLRFQAPKGALSPVELIQLRESKNEILELLRRREDSLEGPITPRPAECSIPLTALQSYIWELYNARAAGLSRRDCTVATRITGPLNVDILKRSVEEVVWRHESLRTRIISTDGAPWQQIDAFRDSQFELTDLSDMPLDNMAEVTRLAEEFVREPVHLSVGPLFASKLFRLNHSEHVLILASDQVISDGISNIILHRDIWGSYRQASQGGVQSPPRLALQFSDYAIWQRRIYPAWRQRHEWYWKERMAEAPRTEIPSGGALLGASESVGCIWRAEFGCALSERLRDLARRERTLPALVFFTIYVTVMSYWCNQRDLVVGFLINGRHRPELQNMIGLLASILYLRIQVADDDCFLTLLNKVDAEFNSAFDNYDYNWVPGLVARCHTELLFNWLHTIHTSASGEACWEDCGDVLLQPFPLEVAWPSKFLPQFSDAEDGVTVAVTYQPDLVAPSRIEWFGHCLRSIGEEFCLRPLAPMMEVFAKLK